MKSKIALLLTFIFIVISCKESENKDAVDDKDPTPAVEEFFKVELDLKIKKDDNIHLYYTEDGSIKFDEVNSVWMEVKGSEDFQKVVFYLKEDIAPTAIRLDLGYGKNIDQKDVEFAGFKISYFGNTIEAKDAAIYNYFYPNETTKRIEGTNKLTRLKEDQLVGPILYPNDNLLLKIKELYK